MLGGAPCPICKKVLSKQHPVYIVAYFTCLLKGSLFQLYAAYKSSAPQIRTQSRLASASFGYGIRDPETPVPESNPTFRNLQLNSNPVGIDYVRDSWHRFREHTAANLGIAAQFFRIFRAIGEVERAEIGSHRAEIFRNRCLLYRDVRAMAETERAEIGGHRAENLRNRNLCAFGETERAEIGGHRADIFGIVAH